MSYEVGVASAPNRNGPGIARLGTTPAGGGFIAGRENADPRYSWNNVTGRYERTPQSIGSDFATITGALNSAAGGGSNYGGPAATTGPIAFPTGGGPGGSGAPAPAQLQHVDTSAANAAAFARAKDQVGQTTKGAMTALKSVLASSGRLGSGSESRGSASVVNRGAQNLSDVSRQQAITDADIARHEAETNYQGDITQRGQDLESSRAAAELAERAREAEFSGNISMRGQDLAFRASQSAQNRSILQALMSASLAGAY
jgi:hypothetical protein